MIRKFPSQAMLLLLVLGLIGCQKSAPARDFTEADAAVNRFQGEWTLVSLNRGGREKNPKILKNIAVKVEQDRLTWTETKHKRDGDEFVVDEYAIQVDLEKSSSEVDFSYLKGSSQGQTRSAIYSLEGNEWKICWSEPDEETPTEFVANAKPVTTLIVLRRKE